jgi:Ca2+-binding RTX toxin-like protein
MLKSPICVLNVISEEKMVEIPFRLVDAKAEVLTALPDGSFVAAWNAAGDVPKLQRFDFKGNEKGKPIDLGAGGLGENLNFAATNLSDGRFVVVWQQKWVRDVVYARIFNANGTPAGAEFKIDSVDAAQSSPKVTALNDGGFVVVSINEGAAVTVTVQADGTQDVPRVLHEGALRATVTTLKDGSLVAFVDAGAKGDYSVHAYIYTHDGQLVARGEVNAHISQSDAPAPVVTTLSDGSFLVFVDGIEGSRDTVELVRYSAAGDVGSGWYFKANAGESFNSHVVKALPGGGCAIAYIVQDSIGSHLYVGHSNTNSLSPLNTSEVSFVMGDASSPEITILNDGRYVVSWITDFFGMNTDALIFDPRTHAVNWTGTALNEQYQGTQFSDRLNGGDGNDYLIGEDGNDILKGGAGIDRLEGGDGNDTYYVDNAKDRVIESGWWSEADKVVTLVSYRLGAEVENLVAVGVGAIGLTGNSLKNLIVGNGADNRLNGGTGSDNLKGGLGMDTFIFKSRLSSLNVDRIRDFTAPDDTIQLDNAIFKKLGSASSPKKLNKAFFTTSSKAKDKNDYIVYDKTKGYLYYDADGSGKGAAILFAKVSTNLKMTFEDFYVI